MVRQTWTKPALGGILLLSACAGPLPTAVSPPSTIDSPATVAIHLRWDMPKAGNNSPLLSPESSVLSPVLRTQQLDLSVVAKFDVSVTASDLPQAVSPSPNPLGITATSATLTVPAGKNRVFRVRGLDANNVAVPGATIGALVDVLGGPTQSVTAGLQSTPTALTGQALLDARRGDLLAGLSASALQRFIDSITVPSSGGTSFQFSPGLVDASAVANAIVAKGGVPTDPGSQAYRVSGGTVQGQIAGLVNGDRVQVSVSDPASQAVTTDTNGNFTIPQVAPGSWTLLADATFYDRPAFPTLQVTAGQTTTRNLDLTPANYFRLEIEPGNAVQGQIVRWSSMPIKVSIVTPTDPSVQFTTANSDAALAAISAWNNQASDFLSMIQVNDPNQADIKVSWVKAQAGTESGVASLVYTTGQDLKVTIQLATSDSGGQTLPDTAVKETAIHEFGHALGLWAHSDVSTDAMFSSTDGRINLNITRRDLNTLRQIYSKPPAITRS